MGGVIIKVARQSGVLITRREFLFQDAQGSTYAVTDASGQPLGPATGQGNRMSFDPFGQRRQASGAPLSLPEQWAFDSSQTTRHGYTGHEQVDALGLIHMNGRLYDPVLGRFIQADPFVQDPANSQSFNRYTYVFNNPLAWTDPSGYLGKREKRWARGVAAIVITVYTGNYAAGLKGWAAAGATAAGGAAAGAVATGSLRGAVEASLTALVFWGVGQGADTWFGVNTGAMDRFTLGHVFVQGAAGGSLASLQGGKFGHGFVQAGMGTALSANVDVGHETGNFFIATMVGGTLSEATGGKFVNGAVTGAMSYAMSAAAQGLARGGKEAFTPRDGDTANGRYGLFAEYAGDPVYEAVYDLGVEGNRLSARGAEYHAFGGTDADGDLVFQGLRRGRSAKMSTAQLRDQVAGFSVAYPGGAIRYSLHTHGSDAGQLGAFENFSPADRAIYRYSPITNRSVTGFLATPRGLLLMHDPSTGNSVQIGRVPAVRTRIGR